MRLYRLIGSMILLLLGMSLLSGCAFGMVVGSGKSVTETRAVNNVNAVEFAFIGELQITQGDEESLTITGDDNIVPLVRTTVRDGVLRIDAGAANVGRPIVPLRYALTVKNLDSLSLSGLGNVEMASLEGRTLAMTLSGAGSLTIGNLAVNDLAITLSGLGSANLSGEVNVQAATVSGAGSYYASGLRSQTASIQIAGVGNAEVWAVETLSAQISGAGSIQYKGSPQVVQQISGIGRVTAIGGD